jgi:hypothetical protein
MAGALDTTLQEWVLQAIKAKGGTATIIEIAKHIWANHESELHASDEMFYTWQYRMRWAGEQLAKAKKLKRTKEGNRARWVLLG